MITTPVKTWMRSFSPSTIFVDTSTVSPTSNRGGSCFRCGFSTSCNSLFIMISSDPPHGRNIYCRDNYCNQLSASPLDIFLQIRLPQVRPALFCPLSPLLQPPLGDLGMIS